MVRSRRQKVSVHSFLIASATFTGIGLLILTLRWWSLDDDDDGGDPSSIHNHTHLPIIGGITAQYHHEAAGADDKTRRNSGCATVEEMGQAFRPEESLRVRKLIHRHFSLHGASTVRALPPEQFCNQGFVIAKASEAGLGNEMYKILTAAALSVMLNRSLIIGQTRHIGVDIPLGIISLIATFPSH